MNICMHDMSEKNKLTASEIAESENIKKCQILLN